MTTTHSDWIDLITEMLWVFERETKLTLRGINDNFQRTGLTFDDEFREHFLDIVNTRVSKTYNQFIRTLEFDELQRRLNDTDNDKWKHSTGYQDIDTPVRPFPAQKRKHLDEFYETNETSNVKRPKMDTRIVKFDSDAMDNDFDGMNGNDHSHTTIGDVNGKYISHLDVIIENAAVESTSANATEVSESTTLKRRTRSSTGNIPNKSVSVEPHPEKTSAVKSTPKSIKVENDVQLEQKYSEYIESAKSRAESAQLPRMKRKLLKISERNKKSQSLTKKDNLNSSSACDESLIQIKTSPNQNVIKSAKKKPTRRLTFLCKICDYTSHKWNFRKHLASQLHKIKTQCGENDDISKYILPQYKFKTSYACQDCGYYVRKKSHFTRHLFSNRHNNWFQCHLCPKLIRGKDMLDLHYAEHKKLCFKCGQPLQTKEMRCKHEFECETPLFQCYICKTYEKDETMLKTHMKKHTRINLSMYKVKIKK